MKYYILGYMFFFLLVLFTAVTFPVNKKECHEIVITDAELIISEDL